MNAIEITGLKRRYGRTDAVHDLTLNIPEGSVFSLLGPNGAGKSTLLKILVNLLEPTAGSARVLGVDSRRLSPKERCLIGYVSESLQLPEWMTVGQFLDYCRPFYPAWDKGLEKQLLGQFALPLDRKVKHLSRGMRVKALLISVLSFHPKLLILDEPFSGLDPVVRDEVAQGLVETARTGDWTVLMASHDIEEVERLTDHVAMIDEGRLRLSEPVESLLSRFRRIEVDLQGGEFRPDAVSATWLGFEQTGARARFVESEFDDRTTRARCEACFPEGAVTAHPMPLRDIYLALARSHRSVAGARA